MAQFTLVEGEAQHPSMGSLFTPKQSIALSSTQIVSLVNVNGNNELRASTFNGTSWSSTRMVGLGDFVLGNSHQPLGGIERFSLSPGPSGLVVTFSGVSGVNGVGLEIGPWYGVFQQDFTGGNLRVIAVQNGPSGEFNVNFGDRVPLFAANGSGQVLFGGAGGTPVADRLWRYDGPGMHTVLAENGGPPALSEFNDPPQVLPPPAPFYPRNRVLTGAGTAVGFAKEDGVGAIYEFASDGSRSIRVPAEGVTIAATHKMASSYTPVQVLGANAGPNGQTLYIGEDESDANARVLFRTGGEFVYPVGGEFDATFAKNNSPTGVPPSGTVTVGGRAVVYVPRGEFGTEGTLHYITPSMSMAATIAPGDSFGDFTLASIGGNDGFDGAQPAINDQGWVVFDATSDDFEQLLLGWNPETETDCRGGSEARKPTELLLGWNPETETEVVIAYAGQTFSLPGDPGTSYEIVTISVRDVVHFDTTDVFKDLLAEDGTVAFGVS
ncbi:MAG TPA: hypothetical protein PKB10_12685, partial [Tepidisphaeraceae bacterium]|nr:hypothetical protein [Tepidisphaeraceae bacterium]